MQSDSLGSYVEGTAYYFSTSPLSGGCGHFSIGSNSYCIQLIVCFSLVCVVVDVNRLVIVISSEDFNSLVLVMKKGQLIRLFVLVLLVLQHYIRGFTVANCLSKWLHSGFSNIIIL